VTERVSSSSAVAYHTPLPEHFYLDVHFNSKPVADTMDHNTSLTLAMDYTLNYSNSMFRGADCYNESNTRERFVLTNWLANEGQ
jgi:hypothetical protein